MKPFNTFWATVLTDTKSLQEWASTKAANNAAITANDLEQYLTEQKRKRAALRGLDQQSVRPVATSTTYHWKQVLEDAAEFKKIQRPAQKPQARLVTETSIMSAVSFAMTTMCTQLIPVSDAHDAVPNQLTTACCKPCTITMSRPVLLAFGQYILSSFSTLIRSPAHACTMTDTGPGGGG